MVEMPGVEPGCTKVDLKDFVASLSAKKTEGEAIY